VQQGAKSSHPGDVVKVAALKDAPEMVVAGGGTIGQGRPAEDGDS
jgi:hypothetical protein